MEIDEILKEKREEIHRIARKHGVARVHVFGSAARGEATENSDIDLLIEVEGPTPPWFPGGLVADLEALLGRRVDVVEPDAIREGMRRRIHTSAIAVSKGTTAQNPLERYCRVPKCSRPRLPGAKPFPYLGNHRAGPSRS